MVEVLRRLLGDRDQRAQVHEQAAVPVGEYDPLVGLRQADAEGDRRSLAHSAADGQVQGLVGGDPCASPAPPSWWARRRRRPRRSSIRRKSVAHRDHVQLHSAPKRQATGRCSLSASSKAIDMRSTSSWTSTK